MKLVEYYRDNRPALGAVIRDEILDIASLSATLPVRMLDLIEQSADALPELQAALKDARGKRYPLSAYSLCCPLPNPRKVLCVAANYREHIRESGFEVPKQTNRVVPQFFAKFPSTCLIGPGAEIPIRKRNVFLDWEVELAVIIGSRAQDIPHERALSHVFGYSIANDISERKLNSDLLDREIRSNDFFFDWLAGKWFDGSLPLGPVIVTADEIDDPQNLKIELQLNGELMQQSSTRHMIFGVAELVAYISGVVTLEPGDIIVTGTPEGTGSSRGICLRAGDSVRCVIPEIGVLENHVHCMK